MSRADILVKLCEEAQIRGEVSRQSNCGVGACDVLLAEDQYR